MNQESAHIQGAGREDAKTTNSARPLAIGELPSHQRAAVRAIRSWPRFHRRVRAKPEPLLKMLPRYSNCVLVAGCQRSGTTMLTRVLASAPGFSRFGFTHDDELDAALVLSGSIELPTDRRYCFQTTYLNERYPEYEGLRPDQKLIWVVRNPYSVVYSMVHHWKAFALNELYEASLEEEPEWAQRERPMPFWRIGLERTRRACIAYAWKAGQLAKVRRLVSENQLMLVDYDELVREPDETRLIEVYRFIGEPKPEPHTAAIRSDSLHKANRLSAEQRELVDRIALPVYEKTRALIRGR